LYDRPEKAHEREVLRRLTRAYRDGLSQEDDDRRLEFRHYYRNGAYDYW
jgi:hypothetical protein